jgi:hypothetical protein
MRAIKLTSPLRVDGTLNDDVYQREKPFGGFIGTAHIADVREEVAYQSIVWPAQVQSAAEEHHVGSQVHVGRQR